MKFTKRNGDMKKEDVVAYVDRKGTFNYRSNGMHYTWDTDGRIYTEFEYNTWNPPMDDPKVKLFGTGDTLEIEL